MPLKPLRPPAWPSRVGPTLNALSARGRLLEPSAWPSRGKESLTAVSAASEEALNASC